METTMPRGVWRVLVLLYVAVGGLAVVRAEVRAVPVLIAVAVFLLGTAAWLWLRPPGWVQSRRGT